MDRLPWIITASLCAEHFFLFLGRIFESVFGVSGFHYSTSHPHQHVNIREGDAPHKSPPDSNFGFLKSLVLRSPSKMLGSFAASLFSGVSSQIRTRQRRVRFDAGRSRLEAAGIDIAAGRHGGVVKWRGRFARAASLVGTNSVIVDSPDVSMASLADSLSSVNDVAGKRVSVLEDIHPGSGYVWTCLAGYS
ncbi:hypothetical protein BC829DRAFT_189985 [Chytridium lagenaria]|nr:hypothetical protein BC829DRAFT_189985 [Chytridium lagenaria]